MFEARGKNEIDCWFIHEETISQEQFVCIILSLLLSLLILNSFSFLFLLICFCFLPFAYWYDMDNAQGKNSSMADARVVSLGMDIPFGGGYGGQSQ